MKRPFEFYLLYLFLFFLSINALYGGISLILRPDGSLLGMNPQWLSGTPFHTFIIPGILLVLFLGLVPALALAGMIRKSRKRRFNRLNIFREKYWGWTFSLYTGLMAIIWIVVQQLLTEYFILQPIIAGTGVIIVILTLLPRIQKEFTDR